MTLEQATAILYPERLSMEQVDRLETISNKHKKNDVFESAKADAQFWHDMMCRLLVPTPLSHEEIIQIMERITK